MADAYLSLGESLIGIATALEGKSVTTCHLIPSCPSILTCALFNKQEIVMDKREATVKEALAAFQKCVDIRVVALGESHEQTKLARECITRFGGKNIKTAAAKKKK